MTMRRIPARLAEVLGINHTAYISTETYQVYERMEACDGSAMYLGRHISTEDVVKALREHNIEL
jgi:hypothetical protein